jgi:tetratricopeptide (TPR) repeat protein
MGVENMAKADKVKARGVLLYKRKNFEGAIAQFSLALTYQDLTPLTVARLFANRAAAYLEWHHYSTAAADCAAGRATLDNSCANADEANVLAQRLCHRSDTVAALLLNAERATKAAFCADPLIPRLAMDAFDFALKCSDAGPAGKEVRGRLLAGRSTLNAKMGDFVAALRDSRAALSERPDDAANALAVQRLENFVNKHSEGSKGGPAHTTHETRVRRVLVSRAASIEVELIEPFIAGTGGRQWEAGTVLSWWLVAGEGAKEVLPMCCRPGSRLLELGC